MTLDLGIMGAAKVERARDTRSTAAIGELPSRDVGPPHGIVSSIVKGAANARPAQATGRRNR
jgi:hypothetical protein